MTRATLISIFRYLVTGGGIAAVYILGTTVGVEALDWPVLPTNIGFYALSTVLGYLINYYWTFGSEAPHGSAFVRYLLVAGAGFGLNTAWIALTTVRLGLPVFVTTTIFTGGWAVISFLLQRNFIYRGAAAGKDPKALG